MNIQIFGTKKCFDTKKAERYFMSQGEFNSVKQAIGDIEAMVNRECKDKEALSRIAVVSHQNKEKRLFEFQQLIKTPIVRNGKKATVGYVPEVWKEWE